MMIIKIIINKTKEQDKGELLILQNQRINIVQRNQP